MPNSGRSSSEFSYCHISYCRLLEGNAELMVCMYLTDFDAVNNSAFTENMNVVDDNANIIDDNPDDPPAIM